MHVTEMEERIAALESRLAQAEHERDAERRAADALREELELLRAAVEEMSIGVLVTDSSGAARARNAAMRAVMRGDPEVLLPDGATPAGPERDPAARALRGEAVDGMESALRGGAEPGRITWITADARPIRGADGEVRAAVTVVRDITEHREIVRELDEAIAANEAEKRALIARLEAGVEALSTPIIEVWDDVLALPVIGVMDPGRGEAMLSRVLTEVTGRGAGFVIIDWTGVDALDASSARHLLDLVAALRLVGAQCVLTGVRPGVATALQDLAPDLAGLLTLRTLKHGLRHCLARRTAGRPSVR